MSASISLFDLFPPIASGSKSTHDLDSPTLAFIGNIPSSSLLHLSLYHLARQTEDDLYSSSNMSEKAKGKRRATDAELENVEGQEWEDLEDLDQPASAGGRRQEIGTRHVLILTPDLAAVRRELASENDGSLFGRSRDAHRTALLERITFKHLPTSAQLNYFLATFYGPSNYRAAELHSTYVSSEPASKIDPSYLTVEPTMVILHSPSSYLDESVHTDSGIEAYATMLALFVSTFSNSFKISPTIVLLDPLANSVSLPIIPPHLAKSRKRLKLSDDLDGRTTPAEVELEKLPLRRAIERFFDCVTEVGQIPMSPTNLDHGHLERWRIEARTKKKSTYTFLEFSTQRIGEDDESGEEEGTTRITVES
ncbi:hypothetical protein JCM5350_004092 [Sporobolomyces pararoseus]